MDTTQSETDLVVVVKARVPRKLKRMLSRIAKRRMVSTSDLVREALDDLLKREAKGKAA
jgi:predicted transcriptional regulator